MLNPPKTLQGAMNYKYGRKYLHEDYKRGYCAWEILSRSRDFIAYQCTRKMGFGPAGLYCRQHAKKVEKL